LDEIFLFVIILTGGDHENNIKPTEIEEENNC